MAPANLNHGGRINPSRGGDSSSARRAPETLAERAARLSEQKQHHGALSRHNLCSLAWVGILPRAAHDGEAGPSDAPPWMIAPAACGPPPLPSIELEIDTSTDEDEDEAAWAARHLVMAHRKSLTTVFIDVRDKAKCRREACKEEELNVRRAMRHSIRLEMVRRGFAIVGYPDSSSDEDTDDEAAE